jgi:hypothetical protein
MKNKTLITLSASLAISVALINTADAAGWQDMLKSATNTVTGQNNNPVQQAVPAAQSIPAGSLTDLLMQRTGVTGAQAQGGAGALFQMAKSKLSPDSFGQLEQAVPGMQGMLGAAPALSQPSGLLGGLSSIASGSGGSAGSLLSVASSFQQQGMSPAMVQQFIPVVIDYVKAHGNDMLTKSLSAALMP